MALLSLNDGVKKLQQSGISEIIISLKPACFPNTSKIRYISAGCVFSDDQGESHIFPAEDIHKHDSKYNMCFNDAPPLEFFNSAEERDFIEVCEPFTDEHAEGRYQGTAKERCNEIKKMFTKLDNANIEYTIACWGYPQNILDWIYKTAD